MRCDSQRAAAHRKPSPARGNCGARFYVGRFWQMPKGRAARSLRAAGILSLDLEVRIRGLLPLYRPDHRPAFADFDCRQWLVGPMLFHEFVVIADKAGDCAPNDLRTGVTNLTLDLERLAG